MSDSKGKAAPQLPEVLQVRPAVFNFTFKLRDCAFMEFKEPLDRNASTVYDLMYTVAKHHGNTIEPDKVQIFKEASGGEPLTNITQKLSELEGVNVFYYDFTPVGGSELVDL